MATKPMVKPAKSPGDLSDAQRHAWERVTEYQRANPGASIKVACKVARVKRYLFDYAKHRLKLGGYLDAPREASDDVEAFGFSVADQIRPGDAILGGRDRRRSA